MTARHYGVVVRWDQPLGIGTIRPDDGSQDVTVFAADVKGQRLKAGMPVWYRIAKDACHAVAVVAT